MFRPVRAASLAALLLSTGACADFLTTNNSAAPTASQALTAAFTAVPVGFSNNTSSFGGDADGVASLWMPGPNGRAFGREGLMGGGLGDAFDGAMNPGRGFGHEGPFGGRFGGGLSCTGAYNAATGRFVCTPITRGGLTITQSASYKTTVGVAQQAFDTATTNTVNVQTAVTGTISWVRDSTRRGGFDGRRGPEHGGHIVGDTATILAANTTINHRSDRTVGGLATGSTRRTVDGTSNGEESTAGSSSRGAFTAKRFAADTTKGLIVPIVDGKKTYPVAGTVIRVMSATVTVAGAAATTASRREVITYDGTDKAKVTITINGQTTSCTMQLPRGRPGCK